MFIGFFNKINMVFVNTNCRYYRIGQCQPESQGGCPSPCSSYNTTY